IENFGEQFQVANRLADGNAELMSVDDAGEIPPICLPSVRDRQEIFVLSEENAAERCGSIQKPVVAELPRAIFFRGDDIDAALAKPTVIGPGTH
ncbi:MAG: hypothetical protein HYR84_14860, partial [Planctomycetes bacterium]|nr:hypothetical protein [Planctomycetota bacterium]